MFSVCLPSSFGSPRFGQDWRSHVTELSNGSRITKQRETIALDRQGTQQERPESPTVTPPDVRVNTRYMNSTKGTSSKRDAPSGIHTLHFKHARRHGCLQAYDITSFYSRPAYSFDLETGSAYEHTHTHIYVAVRVNCCNLKRHEAYVVVSLVCRALLFPIVR